MVLIVLKTLHVRLREEEGAMCHSPSVPQLWVYITFCTNCMFLHQGWSVSSRTGLGSEQHSLSPSKDSLKEVQAQPPLSAFP